MANYLINKGTPNERIISDDEIDKKMLWFCSSCSFIGKPSEFVDAFGDGSDLACPICGSLIRGHHVLDEMEILDYSEYLDPYLV